MAMNDPYGLLASGVPPDIAAQMMGLTREQAVAQALAQQAQSPLETPLTKGRFQGRVSPLSAVSKVIEAFAARQGLAANDQKMADLAGQATTRRAQAMADYQAQRDGMPAQTVPQAAPNDDEGNPMPAVTKAAVPGDPRAAITSALLNPLIANSPLIQADLKKTEPNWAVHKSFDPATGRETQVLVNLNNPSETKAFGGTKAPEMKDVTTTDANGRPVTKFVDPLAQTAPLPQPVKMEMKDTGKVIAPVDPYAPVPLGKTTTPGEDQSRTTQLQVHGLGQDGLPTGDVKEVAKGIAEGRLAPLTSFAMGSPRGQAIMAEVARVNPNYSAIDFHVADKAAKDFGSGKQGNTVRSFNVALSHLDTLDKAADALQNNDIQAVNKVGQFVAQQTGQPAPTNFDAVKKIVGDEIVKAIVGSGGGVSDREAAEKTLARASSPAQLKGVIGQYKELMRGQLGGLRQQYETSTGRKDFDRFLSPEGQANAHSTSTPGVLKFDAQGNPL